MASTGPAPDVTREDVLGVFAQFDGPSTPITTDEVADELDCTDRIARRRLAELADRETLRSRRIDDSTRIWWRPDDEPSTDERTKREEFSAFVDAVEDYAIFMLDPDGVVVSWNEGAERIKGYAEDEIVGEHFSEFYTDEDVEAGRPAENLETAAAEGHVEDEGWRVRDDGSRFWADVAITAIRDDDGSLQGFTKVTRDMTEQREYEQRLRRERDLTNRIVETVPVGICVITADGDVVQANRRVHEWFDVSAERLRDCNVDALDLHGEDGGIVPDEDRPWARVAETGMPVYDFSCRVDLPNAGRRWLSIDGASLVDERRTEDLIVLSIEDVTERRERERRLYREYGQTEKLLQTAPIAIAVHDADGETLMTNRRARDAFGLERGEFIDELETAGEMTVYDADGDRITAAEMPLAHVLETGEAVFDEELAVDTPDGDRRQFRVNAAPVVGPEGDVERVVTAAEDITDLKRQERRLERRTSELETELSEILGRVSDAFYALDDEWRFTHLNDRAATLFGRPRAELLGRSIREVEAVSELIDDASLDRLEAAMDTQEAVTVESYADGLDAWLEFNAYPSESGLSVYFRDVTERKEYERKLEASNERLEQFAYAASHDLQEPLRMVTSYLQLIERRYADELDEAGEEFIDFAVDGADRMRDMIDGLLAYSRVETQGEPFEPVDLEAVLDDAREDLRVRIAESDAEITADALPRVEGDPDQLRQVFQNLLDNAIEYSGDAPPRVHVSAERTGSMWEVAVRDEGIGIEPDAADRIFEVFQRLHGRDEHAGTGIGLALCRRIVERHDGDLWVDSTPGEGATFSFTLPAADADE